eukprot:TRINITY_DN9001_c0_g2_i1.p1 TRINITY_DN9001_c0_g2~~TRINITY_DN9001_c0_g2_i1.p1  ORF type:complete len:219 (+),score=28.78 TRINITY_DN9001_c0_g2_i1:224-880(+)
MASTRRWCGVNEDDDGIGAGQWEVNAIISQAILQHKINAYDSAAQQKLELVGCNRQHCFLKQPPHTSKVQDASELFWYFAGAAMPLQQQRRRQQKQLHCMGTQELLLLLLWQLVHRLAISVRARECGGYENGAEQPHALGREPPRWVGSTEACSSWPPNYFVGRALGQQLLQRRIGQLAGRKTSAHHRRVLIEAEIFYLRQEAHDTLARAIGSSPSLV